MLSMGRAIRRTLGVGAMAGMIGCLSWNAFITAGPQKNLDPSKAMIEALPASGPHPSLGEEARVFDRLVGTWDAAFAEYSDDGSIKRSSGEVRFGWILDGRALQDVWITYPEAGRTEREIGTSVRYYDTKLKQWRVIFVDPAAGNLAIVTGGAVGNRIVLSSQSTNGKMWRWSFNDIQPNSFVWRGEKSLDDGKTWRLYAEYHMMRRGAGSAAAPQTTHAAPDSRRDMITALSAPGPHSSLGDQAQVFGRFVGTWDANYTNYTENGGVTRYSGEVILGWIIDGRATQDIFSAYPTRPGTERSIGTTLRYYDIKTKQWCIVFIAPVFNGVWVMKGGVVGDRIVLLGKDDEGNSLRWSFNDIKPDSFTWRGEISHDSGKTWFLAEEHRMSRRSVGSGTGK
jgi:hypothetical protein